MSGIPGPVVRGQRLMSDDVMREGTVSKVGVVLKRQGDDDGDSSWMTGFFYLPRSCTIPKVV